MQLVNALEVFSEEETTEYVPEQLIFILEYTFFVDFVSFIAHVRQVGVDVLLVNIPLWCLD